MMETAGEIRSCSVNATGRILPPGIVDAGDTAHFMLDAAAGGPLHCMCDGKTARNALLYLGAGDEITIEFGQLTWVNFRDTGPTLVIYARFTSYGRKDKPIY